ncbi:DUF1810 domain-containing protein [uncultured Rhodoblastus sp.]|uniref:DUF1810 domain-containing protein n=1 Tax=uncultured Rhodoblastus sp. TaxID=543037 RepID=UPI0025CE53C2|nr:DUF1810 domain-containing protein [uncultured Rhodoblastus sp.]
MPQDDPFNLRRFVEAQARTMDAVRRELRAGRKNSHWMWFVFPQFTGLGFSPTADFYAIHSLAEARAFLAHPVLGARLRECADLVNACESRDLMRIFGDPDWLKFRSCMTLFAMVAPSEAAFAVALREFCGGESDPLTLARLSPLLAAERKSD